MYLANKYILGSSLIGLLIIFMGYFVGYNAGYDKGNYKQFDAEFKDGGSTITLDVADYYFISKIDSLEKRIDRIEKIVKVNSINGGTWYIKVDSIYQDSCSFK